MAKYIRTDRKKSGTYYWLVEAHRENGKVVQKRLKYLGNHEPIPEYKLVLRHIDDNVVYSKGRLESLYLVYHEGETIQRDWHTERLSPFYIVAKKYRRYFGTVQRKLKKPISVDWSSFNWEYLYRHLFNLVKYDHIDPDDIWLAKASHPATAIAKAKKGQGASIVSLYAIAVFDHYTTYRRRNYVLR